MHAYTDIYIRIKLLQTQVQVVQMVGLAELVQPVHLDLMAGLEELVLLVSTARLEQLEEMAGLVVLDLPDQGAQLELLVGYFSLLYFVNLSLGGQK